MKRKKISARGTIWDRIIGLLSLLFCRKREEYRPDGYHLIVLDEITDDSIPIPKDGEIIFLRSKGIVNSGEFLHTTDEITRETRLRCRCEDLGLGW